MTAKTDLGLRAPLDTDWGYICATWKDTLHNSLLRIPRSIYYRQQHRIIKKLRTEATFRVAYDLGEPNFIWGWSCFEGDLVHYCFVRHSRRKDGVAKMLLHGLPLPLKCSHWTIDAAAIATAYPGIAIYYPDALGVTEREKDRTCHECIKRAV